MVSELLKDIQIGILVMLGFDLVLDGGFVRNSSLKVGFRVMSVVDIVEPDEFVCRLFRRLRHDLSFSDDDRFFKLLEYQY